MEGAANTERCMKAWQMPELGDPWDLLQLAEVTSPAPDAESVRIRVEATDLNFADILQCQGKYQIRRDPPFTPGINSAGTIVEAGADSGLEVGQRVIGPTMEGFGGYGEEALLPAIQCFKLPDAVPSVAAAGMHITFGTSWFALHHRGRLQPGETVLVLAAAGGVGSAAVQMAKSHGCWVVAAAGGDEKTRLCAELGADEVIDYTNEDLYERVMALTDKRGVDVVYDPVGGNYFDVARRLLAWEGRLLVVGFASGTIPSAPANHALVKNYSVVGVHMGGYRERDRRPLVRCYRELHQQYIDRKIDPYISEVVGYDGIPEALHRLGHRGTTGRLVFDPEK